MSKREFNKILETLKPSLANYEHYVSFDKVYKRHEMNLKNMELLNRLIGSRNIESDFENLVEAYPRVIESIPHLLAHREKKIIVSTPEFKEYIFDRKLPIPIYEYTLFMKKTRMFELLNGTKVKDLRDYYLGVEVGMDTNARKNRTGATMEKVVEDFIIKSNPQEYYRQLTKSKIEDKFHVDLDKLIFEKKGKHEANKKFDFVVRAKNQIYLIETNFYGGGGSKLSETARSYKSLNNTLKQIQGINFVWITDGVGWKTTPNILKEAYEDIEHFYSISDLEGGVLNKVWG